MRLGLLAGEEVLSFSPLYFRRIYGLLYEKYTPHDLKSLRQEILQKKWLGFNVTTPYKEAVFSLLDEVSATAAAIQAVNVVSILPDGRWIGENTDFQAARYLLSEMSETYPAWERLIVCGTGGAARAVAYAHAELFPDLPITFLSRSPERKLPLSIPAEVQGYPSVQSANFGENILLVQATPLGMFPRVFELPPFPLECIKSGWIVWDLIYNPHPTLFLARARDRGAHIEGGLRFFRKQADYALKMWSEVWRRYYKQRALV
ncbi:MAG: hypothetical protein RMK19_07100 [Bacteroidia bacterium]|nr:hypothetical protein [Bacteroidia bacterium]MDW8015763.1 hypothetical protein [Bacteroidia bacterium]